jgi:hypothetical protein
MKKNLLMKSGRCPSVYLALLFRLSAHAQPWSGNALSFDGVDDAVSVPGFGTYAPTTEITIEFWQNVRAYQRQYTFNLSPDIDRMSAHVPWIDGAVYWDFGSIAAGGRLAYYPQVSIIGTWQHFAFVASQSGNYMRIYRNGILEAQKAGMVPFVQGADDLNIGGAPGPFGGSIDEFRVWNVARSQADIQANMNQPLTAPQAGLVAYWRFDEAVGNFAVDSSGQDHTGTLLNGPARISPQIPTQTAIGFEDLAPGIEVRSQYQNLGRNIGVIFTDLPPDYGRIPKIAQVSTAEAQSGTQVLDITGLSGEMLYAFAAGRLTTTARRVAVFAGYFHDPFLPGDIEPVTLKAYDSAHNLIGQTTANVREGAGFHALLEVESASDNIASFTVEAADLGKRLGIDDLNFTTPAEPPPPDFALAVVPYSVKLAPGGIGSGFEIHLFPQNGASGDVALSLSPLPTGVVGSFNQNRVTLNGTAATATLMLNALASAPVTAPDGFPVTITATPQSTSVGSTPRSTTVRVVVHPAFTVSAPSNIRLFACLTNKVTVTVRRDLDFQGQINLAISGIPAGIQATLNPAIITSFPGNGAIATSELQFVVPNLQFINFNPIITASSGSQISVFSPQILTAGPRIDSFSPNSGFAPQSLRPGTEVTVQGVGFGPGWMVEFGNPLAKATPSFISEDGQELKVRVPRLATPGFLWVSSPFGCRSFQSAETFSVHTYRNAFGFAFSNGALSHAAGGYGIDDLAEFFGWDVVFEHLPILNIPIIGLPNWQAATLLAVMDQVGKMARGNCTGFSLATQRIMHGDKSLFDFPLDPDGARYFLIQGLPETNAPNIWDATGPDSGYSYAGSPQIEHYVHLQHLAIISDEFLIQMIIEAWLHLTASSTDIYGEVAEALSENDHPLINITTGSRSHTVVAYDLEPRFRTNDFNIYVYNNNYPFNVSSEICCPGDHSIYETGSLGVIHVTSDNRFSGPESYGGGLAGLVVIPYYIVPVQPHLGTVSDVGKIIIPGSAQTTQISDSQGHFMLLPDGEMNTDPATAFPLGIKMPYIGGLGTSPYDGFVLKGTNAYTQAINGVTNGTYTVYHIWADFSAQFTDVPTSTNSSDQIRFDPAGSTVFQTADAIKPLTAQLVGKASNGLERMVTLSTTAFRNGSDQIAFSPTRDTLTYTHVGDATTCSLSIVQPNTNGQNEYFFVLNQAIGPGDAATLTPSDWSHLNSSTLLLNLVHTNGSSQQLVLQSAQGQVNFANSVPGSVVAPVYGLEPSNPSLYKSGNSPSGFPAGTQNYGGALLSSSNFLAQLYGGPTNTPDELLQPISAAVHFGTGSGSGFLDSPGIINVPSAPPGESARMQLRVWDSRGGADPSYESALSDPSAARGVSPSFTSLPLGGGASAVPNLVGLVSFNVWLPGTNANIWVASSIGKWETTNDWQLGIPSPSQPGVLITNAGTKTVLIDGYTASAFAGSMTVSDLTIAAPPNAVNTLYVDSGLKSTPCHILGDIGIQGGGALTVAYANLQLDGTAHIGGQGVGAFTVNGGLVVAQRVSLGDTAGSEGILTLDGGELRISDSLTLGAASISSTGLVTMGGGTLTHTNGTLLIGGSGMGQFNLYGGNADVRVLQVGNGGLSRGALVLGGGQMQTESLLVTSPGGEVRFVGGVLTSGQSVLANGRAFVVGDGSASALLNLPSGTHSYANALAISQNSALVAGCAQIDGSLVNHGAILATCPGGFLTINGPFTNYSTVMASNGATIRFTGTVVNNGQVLTTNGGALEFLGPVLNLGTITGPIIGQPVVLAGPDDQIVNQWANATLNVVAAGADPLAYQWTFNGVSIGSATNSTYLRSSVQPADAGPYQVIISNSSGAITSKVAELTVIPPPSLASGGTRVLVNGTVILRDDFENAVLGGAPVAEFGSWGIAGGVGVTNADYPGPFEGSQYLQILYTNAATLQSVLNPPAAATGDVFCFETMAFMSPSAYGADNLFQFVGHNNGPLSSYPRDNSPLYSAVSADGTVLADGGFGFVRTSTRITYGKWQVWEIKYVVGSDKWSWLVDGRGDTAIPVNREVSPDPSIGSVYVLANAPPSGDVALYLDATPQVRLLNPRVVQGSFTCEFQTLPGKYYFVLSKDGLSSPNWQAASPVIVGDGSIKSFSEPVNGQQRFYRLETQCMCLGANCAAAPAGLVSWWAGEGNANDVTGTYNGTLLNGATFAPGVVGEAFSFDGVDDLLQIGGAPIPPPWTAEMWVNRQDSPAFSSVLLVDVSTALKLEQFNFTRKVGFTQFGVADYTFNYTAPAGTWVHLAFVGSATNTQLYVNGALQDTIAAGIPLPLAQFGSDGNGDRLKGLVDELSVYNRALSASEVQAIYSAGASGKCR